MKFENGIDLLKRGALSNAAIHPLSAAPATPVVGQAYYDTTLGQLLTWSGSAWGNLATNATQLNGQSAAFYLARGNHTGTQTAATISDLATTVKAYRLDEFAAPIAAVSFNSQRITNLADPVAAQDAATMGWVQSQISNAAAGLDVKGSVRIVLTTNDTLSGLAARDGVTPSAGDRILATGQTTASQNGVYVAAAGAWTRATDADQTGEITPGATWFVEEGTANGKTTWRVENTGTITLGTTGITINKVSAATNYTASLGVQMVGNDIRAQVVANGGIQAVAGGLQLDTSIATRKFAGTYGTGALTSIPVTHNLGTKDVQVMTRYVANDEAFLTDWVATDVNTVTLTFAVAPAAASIRVVVQG